MDVRRTGVLLGMAGLVLTVGCSAGDARPAADGSPSAAAATAARPVGPYVALGDSYTAGLRITPQVGTPAGCARSGVNYPSLVAKALGLSGTAFTDVSCSGATTRDLTGAQQTEDGTNPPQLDALSPATRLVTLGIGGNDAGFVEVLGRCAEEGVKQSLFAGFTGAPAADSPCRSYYSAGGAGGAGGGEDQVQRRVEAAGERLGDLLQEVKRRSPQARVYVVGYPELLPTDPASCTAVLGRSVAAGDIGFLAEKERQLNAMLRQRAEAAGAGFVDTYAPSAGHDMCAGETTRWIEPPLPAAGLAPVHPNAAGQQAMAAAVLQAVRA
ncbi:SGNH/GDSL hydrolase family protein [Kitasatospora sp. GP82]|uniref:SGNH/GDSL hydrolase family protein n=1 Tax=Kitasatospora sp. GP82 TaxID=3035089 RepID=UPI0024736451|nr:SGNH/GDSL hydrolase family protein [Kitasatospora sp. GP82]MDH6125276.1 lysophospholipase L1-like esterase [Kitasatospora sp. GP82]